MALCWGPRRAGITLLKPEEKGVLKHMLKGTVKWFSEESGCGSIRPDEGGENVLLRRMLRASSGFETLEKGAKVAYEVSRHGYGMLWAAKVSRIAT